MLFLTFLRFVLITIMIVLWTLAITQIVMAVYFRDRTLFLIGGMIGMVAYMFSRDLIKSESND
jgi:hypothetical protein